MIVFCDIDGTVADNSHRTHFIGKPKGENDWDAFYNPALVMQDPPILVARGPLTDLTLRLGVRFYFLTGRPERLRQTTEEWLAKHFDVHEKVLMRGDNDWRKANVYKEDSIKSVTTHTEERLFIDDDERNFEMYSRWGIYLKAPECWSVFR